MIFLGVLCLAACVLAQPSVYVSRTTYEDYPYPYYYPLSSYLTLAPEKEGEARKLIFEYPSIPDGRTLPLASIVLEPAKSEDDKEEHKPEEGSEIEKEEEPFKEEELKTEEAKHEEGIPIVKFERVSRPVLVRLKPPQFITDFIQSLPISFPYDFPFLGPILGKPPATLPVEPVVMPAPSPAERFGRSVIAPAAPTSE